MTDALLLDLANHAFNDAFAPQPAGWYTKPRAERLAAARLLAADVRSRIERNDAGAIAFATAHRHLGLIELPKPPETPPAEDRPRPATYYENMRGRFVRVPEPPPLDLKPTRPHAVVTVVAREEGRAMFEATGDLMRRYAERLDADFVICDWPGLDEWPMSSKYSVWRALEHYARIAYVDADVILRPGCVNLFEACRYNEIGIFDELAWHRRQPQHGCEHAYRKLRAEMGFGDGPCRWYCNCGVVVLPHSAIEFLAPPTVPIPPHHCAEQDLFNARVEAAYLAGRCKLRLLDRRCNWEHWTDFHFAEAPPDAILHCSGMRWEGDVRFEKMKRWAAQSLV